MNFKELKEKYSKKCLDQDEFERIENNKEVLDVKYCGMRLSYYFSSTFLVVGRNDSFTFYY